MTWTTVRRTRRERMSDCRRLDQLGLAGLAQRHAANCADLFGLLAMCEAGGELIEDGGEAARFCHQQRMVLAREQRASMLCRDLLACGSVPNAEEQEEIRWLEARCNA